MIETGAWTNLKAPIEELFIHAAYLVVPHAHTLQPPPLIPPSPAATAVANYPTSKKAQLLKARQAKAKKDEGTRVDLVSHPLNTHSHTLVKMPCTGTRASLRT